MLVHRCDVYHMNDRGKKVTFGVPVDNKPSYGAEADILNVPCYITKGMKSSIVFQAEPNAVISDSFNVHFLKGTDIRTNDKIIHEGIPYKVSTPRNVRNHHIEAQVERVESL